MLRFIGVGIVACSIQFSHADFTQVPDLAFRACLNKLAQKNSWSEARQFTRIVCHNKKIKSIDGLAAFNNISKLSLYNNKLEQVELPALPRLEHLNLSGNRLTMLSIRDFSLLKELYVFKNKLETLYVSNTPKLEKLKANNNKMTEIQFGNSTALSKLYLFNNELKNVDMTTVPSLTYFDARHNPMPDEFYDYLDSLESLTALHDGNADDW